MGKNSERLEASCTTICKGFSTSSTAVSCLTVSMTFSPFSEASPMFFACCSRLSRAVAMWLYKESMCLELSAPMENSSSGSSTSASTAFMKVVSRSCFVLSTTRSILLGGPGLRGLTLKHGLSTFSLTSMCGKAARNSTKVPCRASSKSSMSSYPKSSRRKLVIASVGIHSCPVCSCKVSHHVSISDRIRSISWCETLNLKPASIYAPAASYGCTCRVLLDDSLWRPRAKQLEPKLEPNGYG
mmetsp:Transcript_78222/g.173370  ORF Transcript_78222/g.173370 Transcript_78222/m.173370 type:complete len:242 (+) Transcript_78222:134-859(+)